MKNNYTARIIGIIIALIAVFVFHEVFYIRIMFGISLSVFVILVILFFIRFSQSVKMSRIQEVETEREELNEYKPVVEKPLESEFVAFENQNLIILDELFDTVKSTDESFFFNYRGILELSEKTPVINIIEKGEVKASYRLDNFDNEDFSESYLYVRGRGNYSGGAVTLKSEGVIIGHPIEAEDGLFNMLDCIVYRFETHFIDADNNERSKSIKEKTVGKDIDSKGFIRSGYIIPSNYRCVGICNNCKDTFAFKVLNFPMAHCEPVYSDDGQTTAELSSVPIDKNNWSITLNNITFRYYNSFCCPHCGAPYIDYNSHRELKRFGNLGCVHLGKEEILISALSELRNEGTDPLDIIERDIKKIL